MAKATKRISEVSFSSFEVCHPLPKTAVNVRLGSVGLSFSFSRSRGEWQNVNPVPVPIFL